MALSSTQIGAIGENLPVNAVMKASDGRLSAFQPVADDDGLDVLFFEKETGNAIAIQLKCRTVTLFKKGTKDRGNVTHFHIRKATFNKERRQVYLVAALFNDDLTEFKTTWFIPLTKLPEIAHETSARLVIRPNSGKDSADRFAKFRCETHEDLAQRIINACSGSL